ncbi:MAG: hypothetical protein K6F20_09890 [Bacteroidaceae bacterium]|nr:hypothetical protein [Bacteroidaceae bacterium]
MRRLLFIIALLCPMQGIRAESELFHTFSEPEMKYRPQVRWWWNGDKVTAHEILRELDVMKAAGIGGVEINPIAFPGGDSIGLRTLEWCSPEWCRMVKTAVDGCRDRGMVCDMIVGSGWPFGSERLSREQQLQLLTVETFDVARGSRFEIGREEILSRVNPPIFSPYPNPTKDLLYLRLMPKHIVHFTEGVNLDEKAGDERISIAVPEDQDYVLYCFVKLNGFMAVINGAPGAQGPVLNHYDGAAVRTYLERLSTALGPVLGGMGSYLRAAFCDSFETEGSNWDDHMRDEFRQRRGYEISPYLPYIIYKVGPMGNPIGERYGSDMELDEESADLIERVRNDFERTMRELFREGFLEPFNEWCRQNGLKSRIQAYGRGLHPVESSMILDIPECESWMRASSGRELPDNSMWARGYSLNNKMVASGSFLAGNNMVSCEEQTNTDIVFFASMENLKVTGDMSNLSGVNQSILHGFNYNPVETPFPGWVRYGCYFNERNTWWPHIKMWMDYKARLSALFQNVRMQADVAILPAFEDLWSKLGAQRDPFPDHLYPAYAYNLWEAVHQSGCGCDYISEGILERGRIKKGRLSYGDREWGTLLLADVESLSPMAARRLRSFVSSGGRVICIGKAPWKSHGLKRAAQNDAAVRKTVSGLERKYPQGFVRVAPPNDEPMLNWWLRIMQANGLRQDVVFSQPNKFLSQNYYKGAGEDVFFIVNYSATEETKQTLSFPSVDREKQAWIWDAETGRRYRLPDWQDGLHLHLGPMESRLLVFDNETEGESYCPIPEPMGTGRSIEGPWNTKLTNALSGQTFNLSLADPSDLNRQPMAQTFSGTIEYTSRIMTDRPQDFSLLDAGGANGAVVELILNGTSLGRKWYGNRRWDVRDLLRKGENVITLRLTTTLGNYVKSLKDNPVAQGWTGYQRAVPIGLTGNVRLY